MGAFLPKGAHGAKTSHKARSEKDGNASESHEKLQQMHLPYVLFILQRNTKYPSLPKDILRVLLSLLATLLPVRILSLYNDPKRISVSAFDAKKIVFTAVGFTKEDAYRLILAYCGGPDCFQINGTWPSVGSTFVDTCCIASNIKRASSQDVDGWVMSYTRVECDSLAGIP
jgi:hypothetical protein